MPPLEVATEANQNDRLRTSQTYPGAIQRKFWTLMQAPETRDRMLNFTFMTQFFNVNFLGTMQDLMLSGHLQMHFTKIVIFIGGPPDSVSETKLYKTMKVF